MVAEAELTLYYKGWRLFTSLPIIGKGLFSVTADMPSALVGHSPYGPPTNQNTLYLYRKNMRKYKMCIKGETPLRLGSAFGSESAEPVQHPPINTTSWLLLQCPVSVQVSCNISSSERSMCSHLLFCFGGFIFFFLIFYCFLSNTWGRSRRI